MSDALQAALAWHEEGKRNAPDAQSVVHTQALVDELAARDELLKTASKLIGAAERHRDNAFELFGTASAELAAMRDALRSVGIFRSDEAGDDGSEWCVTREPRGEEPVGSLEEALRQTMQASFNDGAASQARGT